MPDGSVGFKLAGSSRVGFAGAGDDDAEPSPRVPDGFAGFKLAGASTVMFAGAGDDGAELTPRVPDGSAGFKVAGVGMVGFAGAGPGPVGGLDSGDDSAEPTPRVSDGSAGFKVAGAGTVGFAFSCGCATESVLLDYYMWKSVRVTSESTKRKEGWKHRVMDPRTRAFSLEAIQSFGGIRVDDLYFKDAKNRSQNDQLSVTKQIDRLIAENVDALHQNQFRQNIAKVIIK